jgi:hypothetical protein
MKPLKIFILLLLTAPVFWSAKAQAQCNPSGQIDKCVPTLPAGFTFLKSYEVNEVKSSNGKVEYSLPFAKDTQYIVNICTEGASSEGIVITLYDFNRHELASSKIDGQYVSAIMFNCKSTGIYYISYTFEKTMKFCGGSILGFKK